MSKRNRSRREVDEHRLIAYVGGDRGRLTMARTAGLLPRHFRNQVYATEFAAFLSEGRYVKERITLTSPRPAIIEDGEAIGLIEKLKRSTPAEKPVPEPIPASNVLTPADRARWYDQVLADVETKNLSPLDYVVAVLIGKRADKTGVAFPGYVYLAGKAAVTTRSIQDVVRKLEERGHLRIARHRDASPYAYFTLLLKSTKPAAAAPEEKPKIGGCEDLIPF